MTASELRSLTAQTLGGSPVRFLIDGKAVEYQGFRIVHDRATDADGKPVDVVPVLTMRLRTDAEERQCE